MVSRGVTVGRASDVADSGAAVRAAARLGATGAVDGKGVDAGDDSAAGVVADPAGAGAVARTPDSDGDAGGAWGDVTGLVVVAAGFADASGGGAVLMDGDSGVGAGFGETDSWTVGMVTGPEARWGDVDVGADADAGFTRRGAGVATVGAGGVGIGVPVARRWTVGRTTGISGDVGGTEGVVAVDGAALAATSGTAMGVVVGAGVDALSGVAVARRCTTGVLVVAAADDVGGEGAGVGDVACVGADAGADAGVSGDCVTRRDLVEGAFSVRGAVTSAGVSCDGSVEPASLTRGGCPRWRVLRERRWGGGGVVAGAVTGRLSARAGGRAGVCVDGAGGGGVGSVGVDGTASTGG